MKRLWVRWLIGVCFLMALQAASSEAQNISIGGNLGAGHVPLTDWEDFFGGLENSHYEMDRLALYWELFLRLGIADHHTVKLSVEHITTSSSLATVSVFIPGPGSGTYITEWDISSVPVGLTYEFLLSGYDAASTMFFGAGVAIYLSEVKYQESTLYSTDPMADFPPQAGSRDGKGYGAHGYIGLRVRVIENLNLQTQVRGRWADGMGFDDEPKAIDVNFTGIDLTVGFEWMFR